MRFFFTLTDLIVGDPESSTTKWSCVLSLSPCRDRDTCNRVCTFLATSHSTGPAIQILLNWLRIHQEALSGQDLPRKSGSGVSIPTHALNAQGQRNPALLLTRWGPAAVLVESTFVLQREISINFAFAIALLRWVWSLWSYKHLIDLWGLHWHGRS